MLKVATLENLPDEVRHQLTEALAPGYLHYKMLVAALVKKLGGEVSVARDEINALADEHLHSWIGAYEDRIEAVVGDEALVIRKTEEHAEYVKNLPCTCGQCDKDEPEENQDEETLKRAIFTQALLNVGGLPN